MIRKAMLTLGVMALAVSGFAQGISKCGSDDFLREQMKRFPNIASQKVRLDKEIANILRGTPANPRAKVTGGLDDGLDTMCWAEDVRQFDVPVVVHIIYDYAAPGAIAISDNDIYNMINRMNAYYNMANPDLSGIIPPFKPYIGDAHITFHLAARDPQNNPTRGIVRSYSYLTAGGDESAKIAPWPPTEYLNIYLENFIGMGASNGIVLAYATFPESFSDNPYAQGVISRTDQAYTSVTFGDASTISHEVGHFFSLQHPWNSNGQAVEGTVCGDDEVDDTPPTIGHFSCGPTKLYDTMCATGYMKQYDSTDYYKRTCIKSRIGGSIDYPDTTNTQNIMDYSACSNQMFTKGQVARMRATMRDDVGFRDSLVSPTNLVKTGVTDAAGNFLAPPDIAPTADFSVNRNYVCADGATNVTFTNRSYNDTLESAAWTFGNGGGTSSNLTAALANFSTPGWVTVSLTAIGNSGSGSNTLTRSDLVYAADPTPINPIGYFQDFNPGSDVNRYPIFNYYGTDHKWELVNNAGVYDFTSIRYANYDNRSTPLTIADATTTPGGVYADFYTPPFDVSNFGTNCNVDFFSAGAFATAISSEMKDTLLIYASTDCGASWIKQGVLAGGELANNGFVSTPFTPIWSQWKEHSIALDAFTARSSATMLRFRFKSGTNIPTATGFSRGTGNNFYLDRLRISDAPLGVSHGVIVNLSMDVVPNPTSGAATVSINGGDNSVAEMTVTDVTGKLVYNSSVKRTATTTKMEIPAQAISAKGLYLVKIVTNGATETQKLVVY